MTRPASWLRLWVTPQSGKIPPRQATGFTMQLPASVQAIADVIGSDQALYLVGQLPRTYMQRGDRKGGQSYSTLYVPLSLKPDHPLVQIIGQDDAQAMVRAFGGEVLKPANCNGIYRQFRDQNIARMVADGIPASLVAEWMEVTERQVRNIVRVISTLETVAANDNTPRATSPT